MMNYFKTIFIVICTVCTFYAVAIPICLVIDWFKGRQDRKPTKNLIRAWLDSKYDAFTYGDGFIQVSNKKGKLTYRSLNPLNVRIKEEKCSK